MAETVEGQFTFTILDHTHSLYIIKGQNPMAIYQFAKGFYLYASTEEILQRIVKKLGFIRHPHNSIEIPNGQILRIDQYGERKTGSFQEKFYFHYSRHLWGYDDWWDRPLNHSTPLTDLLTTANNLEYSMDDIVDLMDYG